MLHLIVSNRSEKLMQCLHERLEQSRPSSPLQAQQVVVPSLAVRRAITLDTAQRYGICTNMQFAFLAQWLWQAMGKVVRGIAPQTPFDAKVLAWRIDQQFANTPPLAGHPRLGPYLKAADDAMRFELAQRTATLFEQYTTYRADWLQKWSRDEPLQAQSHGGVDSITWRQDEAWQRALWRQLTTALPSALDDPAQRFVTALVQHPDAARATLPADIHVFALPSLAPQHLRLLQAMSQVIDVHVYAHNPCQEYWFDIVSEKRRLHLTSMGRVLHTDVGHPLLAAWGGQTQAQMALMIAQLDDNVMEDAQFEAPIGANRLARLQRDILLLQEPGSDTETPALRKPSLASERASAPTDTSIEVHVCHSLRRELEALHNRLLALFAQPGAPTPDQVLVVTPDLDGAAPMIDAVFGAAEGPRSMAYTITGRSNGDDAGVVNTFMALLDLGGSRFKASDLLALLQMPLIMQQLGWSSDDTDTAAHWLQGAGMRWGLDAAHRKQLGFPDLADHSLQDALDRLVLGHVMPDVAGATPAGDIFLGKLPAGHAVGSQALLLGTLEHLSNQLHQLQTALAQPQTADRWHLTLLGALDTFMQAELPSEVEGLRALRAALTQWHAQAEQAQHEGVISTAVMRASIDAELATKAMGGVPSGSVTFASMSSLRGLAYRVVVVVGLNDGAFPARATPLEFDLMAFAPRPGDRQRKQDDRNVMLDLVLSARDALWLSYTGRDLRSNELLPPSTVVSELLDTLARADGIALKDLEAQVTTLHPLQPFAASLFAPDAPVQLRSFHAGYAHALMAGQQALAHAGQPAKVANARGLEADDDDDDASGGVERDDDPSGDNQESAPLFMAPLPPPSDRLRTVTLDDLKNFFANPSKHLLRTRLAISLPTGKNETQDDEPFAMDRREASLQLMQWLPLAMAGADDAQLLRLARAGTFFASGPLGDHAMREQVQEARQIAQTYRAAIQGQPVTPPRPKVLTFDINGQAWTLSINLSDVWTDGLHRVSASKLRARQRLHAWIDHLALGALVLKNVQHNSHLTTRDHVLSLNPVQNPTDMLQTLVETYAKGLVFPLAFMPNLAWAIAEGRSISAVATQWHGRRDMPGDADDEHVRLARRGLPPLINDPDCAPVAHRVFGPLLAAIAGSEKP